MSDDTPFPSAPRAALVRLLPELLPDVEGPVLVVAPWPGPAAALREAGHPVTESSPDRCLPADRPRGGYGAALLVEWSGDRQTLPTRLGRLHALLATEGRAVFAGPVWADPDAAEEHGEVASQDLTRRLYEAAFAVTEEGRPLLGGEDGEGGEGGKDGGRRYEVQTARRDAYPVRGWRPGDEESILDLFEEAFGFRRSVERWRWEYRDNPWGGPRVSVATDGEGRVLAHYAGYPMRLWDCRGDEPVVHPVHQIGNTMTAREARRVGRGVTNLLNRTTRHFYATWCRHRVAFNYGVNTGKIQRYYRRAGGFGFFGPVPYRVCPVARGTFPDLGLVGRVLTGFRVEPVDCFDGRWDELFARVRGDYGVLMERTAAYLNWRYLACPDVDYAPWAVFRRGRLVGWGVFRRQEERLVWGDALFDPQCPDAVGLLLAQVLAAPENAGVERLEGWLPDHPGWWGEALRRIGFAEEPEPQELGTIFVAFELEPDDAFQASFWHLKGDSDLF